MLKTVCHSRQKAEPCFGKLNYNKTLAYQHQIPFTNSAQRANNKSV